MRFGASTFIWTSPLTDAGAADLAPRIARLGFDVFEACVEDPAHVSAEGLRRACEPAGLGIAVCGAFGPDRNLSHADPAIREQGLEYLRACIDLAAAVGAPDVIGPMYSAVGETELLAPDDRERQRERAAAALREAAAYAGERGVGLALEPLNRFETDLVNTVEQGLELCERIGAGNVGLLLDTFHMNIEEKDLAAAVGAAGAAGRLRHFHACENDRGTPGTGHVGWDAVLPALAATGFDGIVSVESFTPDNQAIARAVSLWRPLDAAPDELAGGGLAFLRERLG
jgi:D-psicose/D-tagatose/L-ribulose 3-epimerase